MTNIVINPTVKKEIESRFGINALSKYMIATYEGVYNMAYQDGFDLKEGHKIAMQSLVKLSKILGTK